MWCCFRILLLSILLFSGFRTVAEPVKSFKELADEPYWRALLHFPKGAEHSEIVDIGFFLAPDGARNPYAELRATVQQLNAAVSEDANSHAQCRFIARFHWLKRHLPNEFTNAPVVSCPLFSSWTDQQQISSVSAVFASGYLGNPASFYGHILLKLNSSNQNKNILQQQSLNFGAAVPDAEHPLVYIAKGLFGGYKAVFSHGLFYKNVQTYGEAELRDLWEYQLQLEPEQVQQLVFHAWELIGRDYKYFFLKQNCAYRMAELLELVIDKELISKRQLWAMPVTVFHRLSEVQHNDIPLVQHIIHHPSRQNRFHQRFLELDIDQRNVASAIIDAGFWVHSDAYAQLSAKQQSEVLEMLFDYLEFLRINEHVLFSDDAKQRLLKARLALPVAELTTSTSNDATPPHSGTLPSMLQLSAVQKNTANNAIQLRFRAAYYDLLTADAGRAPYSALSMFDITLRYDGDVDLQRFELLNIENMNLGKTGLPGDGGYAWKLNIAYAPQHLACDDCLAPQVTAGLGKAQMLADNILTYALTDGSLHSNTEQTGMVSLQPRLGVVADITPWWRMQLEAGRSFYIAGNAEHMNWYSWQHRFGSWQGADVRLGIQRKKETELTLAYSFYW